MIRIDIKDLGYTFYWNRVKYLTPTSLLVKTEKEANDVVATCKVFGIRKIEVSKPSTKKEEPKAAPTSAIAEAVVNAEPPKPEPKSENEAEELAEQLKEEQKEAEKKTKKDSKPKRKGRPPKKDK